MVVRAFPPVESADEHGLLAVGGDLDPETLVLAYSSGIFPWPWDEETPLVWFSPPERGVLFFDELTIPRRFERQRKQHSWTVTWDRCTAEVIEQCARSLNRRHGGQTWIIPAMVEAYQELARLGICHSVETWNGDRLVGGLYGISLGGMFAGESMFYLESGASKLALVTLIAGLKQAGLEWMDCQQVTPLLGQFGAREVERGEFLTRLRSAIRRPPISFDELKRSTTERE